MEKKEYPKWYIFWKYTVISEAEKLWKDRVLFCRCSCWVEKNVRSRHLVSWAIKSCWKCFETLEIQCNQCLKKEVVPFYKRNKQFCSVKCRVDSTITKEIVKCLTCAWDVVKNQSRSDKKFCSSSCRSIFTQAIHHNIDIEEYKEVRVEINKRLLKQRKSTEYKKAMKQAMIRDNYLCVTCWSIAQCVHHIKHVKNFPELIFELDNLKSLCNLCHKKEHAKN